MTTKQDCEYLDSDHESDYKWDWISRHGEVRHRAQIEIETLYSHFVWGAAHNELSQRLKATQIAISCCGYSSAGR